MDLLPVLALLYLGVGAALHAHPPGIADPADFGPSGQARIFRATFRDVVLWPAVLSRSVERRDRRA